MARKRLSDLLREEVKKTTDGESETPDASEVENNPNNDSAASKTKGFSKSSKAKASSEAATAESTTSLQADADAKVAELQAALEQSQKREETLQQEISHLKADLKAQTTAAKDLQTNLKEIEAENQQLEAELTKVKQTALQLADSNAELKQQLEQQRVEQQPKKNLPAQATKSSSAPLAPTTNKPANSSALSQQEILRRRQADSLAHPVFPSEKPPGAISDRDLGWFD